jgi:hypothetical protein
MANPGHKPGVLEAAIAAYHKAGSIAGAARLLGLATQTTASQIEAAKRTGLFVPSEPTRYPGRIVIENPNCRIMVGSDLHAWPGPQPTGFRAFVHLIKKRKPDIIILNGDGLDMSKVSRHPPLNWGKLPEVREEIETAQDWLGEIEALAPKHARKIWACGNHDSRFEIKLASHVPEMVGVPGASLRDHFPLWEPCWSVFINDRPDGLVVKHRGKGGVHAPWNNVIHAGRSICTGHLHSQKVIPHTTYNKHTNYGIDTGCLADPWAEQFAYLEDGARNWVAGCAELEFRNGELLPPSLCTVLRPGTVSWHGELIEV